MKKILSLTENSTHSTKSTSYSGNLNAKSESCKRRVQASDTALQNAPDDEISRQMQDLFTKESVRMKKAEKKLKDFLSKIGNLPNSNRVWVNGFNRCL